MKTGTLRDLTALTPEQEKAFKRMQRAHKDFLKAGGRYYTVLETVYAYNGMNLSGVDTADNLAGSSGFTSRDDPCFAGDLSLPCIMDTGLSGFADDAHYFIPAAGVEVIAESDVDDGFSGWEMDEDGA